MNTIWNYVSVHENTFTESESLPFEAEENDFFSPITRMWTVAKNILQTYNRYRIIFSLYCNIYCAIGYYSEFYISVICLIFKMILSFLFIPVIIVIIILNIYFYMLNLGTFLRVWQLWLRNISVTGRRLFTRLDICPFKFTSFIQL